MRLNLKILLPVLPEAIGRKDLEVEFAGETVNDLIEHLIARYGRKARQALY
jgi:molybdopterin converting factor small subunit